MSKVFVMDHPLIQHKIGWIRRKETGSKEFRTLISEIAMLMCYEATRDLKLTDIENETPICRTTVKELKRKETGSSTNLACRSWNGRRNACNDSCSKSRTHRTLP